MPATNPMMMIQMMLTAVSATMRSRDNRDLASRFPRVMILTH
jgi:hypothetical protein